MNPNQRIPNGATRPRKAWVLAGLFPIAAYLPGCDMGEKHNPSFPLTVQRAESELGQMRADPVALRRPVVVLGGWGDITGLPPAYLAKQLRLAVGS